MTARELFAQMVNGADMSETMRLARNLPWRESLKFYGGVFVYYFMFLPYPRWLK